MEIKNYLGFTDNMSAMQKARTEKTLKKRYRYDGTLNGRVMSRREFIITMALNPANSVKEEDCVHYTGKNFDSKVKHQYFCSMENNLAYVITKTEFDFFNYLRDNNLNTEKTMIAYEKAEEAKKQEEEEKEKQKQFEATELLNKIQREREEALEKATQTEISDADKKLVEDVYMYYFGVVAPRKGYEIVNLVYNFDNKYCKEEAIDRLRYNNNKASIKIFECLTGLKLPKTEKERVPFLKKLTMSDFKGKKEFKQPKKYGDEEFYIQAISSENPFRTWCRVSGTSYRKYDVDMFLRRENGNYILSTADSGLRITTAKTKKDCIENLDKFVKQYTLEKFKEMVSSAREIIYNKIGVNPKYK